MKQTMLAQPTVTGGLRPVVELFAGVMKLPRGSPTECKVQSAKCKVQSGRDEPPGGDRVMPEDVSRGSPAEGKMQNAKRKQPDADSGLRTGNGTSLAVYRMMFSVEIHDGPLHRCPVCIGNPGLRYLYTVIKPPELHPCPAEFGIRNSEFGIRRSKTDPGVFGRNSSFVILHSSFEEPPGNDVVIPDLAARAGPTEVGVQNAKCKMQSANCELPTADCKQRTADCMLPKNDGRMRLRPEARDGPWSISMESAEDRLFGLQYPVFERPGLNMCAEPTVFRSRNASLETCPQGAGMAELWPEEFRNRISNIDWRTDGGRTMHRAEARDGPVRKPRETTDNPGIRYLQPDEDLPGMDPSLGMTVFRSRKASLETCPDGAGVGVACQNVCDGPPDSDRMFLRAEARAELVRKRTPDAGKTRIKNLYAEEEPSGINLSLGMMVFRKQKTLPVNRPGRPVVGEVCQIEIKIQNAKCKEQNATCK